MEFFVASVPQASNITKYHQKTFSFLKLHLRRRRLVWFDNNRSVALASSAGLYSACLRVTQRALSCSYVAIMWLTLGALRILVHAMSTLSPLGIVSGICRIDLQLRHAVCPWAPMSTKRRLYDSGCLNVSRNRTLIL